MKLQINKQILEKIVWSYELETFTNTMTLIVMYDHGIINKQSFFQTWKNIKNGEFNKKKNIIINATNQYYSYSCRTREVFAHELRLCVAFSINLINSHVLTSISNLKGYDLRYGLEEL